MPDLEASYRSILAREFKAKQAKNKRFSLRAFANLLKCDPTQMSKILSGKLILSVDMAGAFAKTLKLSEEDRKNFILSAAEEQKCRALSLVDRSLTDCGSESDSEESCSKSKKGK